MRVVLRAIVAMRFARLAAEDLPLVSGVVLVVAVE